MLYSRPDNESCLSFLTVSSPYNHQSRAMRKPRFCICENKGADQLRLKFNTCMLLLWALWLRIALSKLYANEPVLDMSSSVFRGRTQQPVITLAGCAMINCKQDLSSYMYFQAPIVYMFSTIINCRMFPFNIKSSNFLVF